MSSQRWRLILIGSLTLFAIYLVLPTIYYFSMPKDKRNDVEAFKQLVPDWLPQRHINLGLDLQGGVQFVLGVDTSEAVDNKLGRAGTELMRWSADNGNALKNAYVLKGQQKLRVELASEDKLALLKTHIKTLFSSLEESTKKDTTVDFKFNDEQIKTIKQSAVEQAEKVIRSRIDKWGVAEPSISRRADGSVLVQLPGFKDPDRAKELLGRTAQLKFKLVDDDFRGFDEFLTNPPTNVKASRSGGSVILVSEDRQALVNAAQGKVPADKELLFKLEPLVQNKVRYTSYIVNAATEFTGEDIIDAYVTYDQNGFDNKPLVVLKFTGSGGKRFADVTGANINKRLAIILDDLVQSDPVIQSKISGGSATITLGNRSFNEAYDEANQLALILKSGALPATIKILEQRQVGASLGPELASQGITSAAVGVLFVFAFMLLWYRRPGAIACLALLLNGIFLLAFMAAFGFALSLPGIAGFILTLGVAVDSNVLINERIRQELKEGKSSRKAIENGFKKVFSTIFDSNITSLIAAVVLLETSSSGPIRGFAITLILGLGVSLFTALYCSRVMFEIICNLAGNEATSRKWLGGEAAENARVFNFNFLKYAPLAVIFTIVVASSVIGVSAIKGVNWSVDFAGGTELHLGFGEKITPDVIRKSLEDAGVEDSTLQALGEDSKQFLVRFEKEDAHKKDAAAAADAQTPTSTFLQTVQSSILKDLSQYKPEILQVDDVGPQIGKELRTQGVLSVLYSIIAILIYVALRFDFRFGPGAIVKMLADSFVILGFYVFAQRSFDLTSVAALLTGIGYSVNDVIVIYDRIRENLRDNSRRSLWDNINISLNETLTRSLNTSVITLISLIGILVFGTGSIWNFAMAMAIGVVAATFSSTFIATACVLWFQRKSAASAKSVAKAPSTR